MIHRTRRENSVAYALLVLGLAALFLDVVGSDYLWNEVPPNSDKCLYQILIDSEPRACVFLDKSDNIAGILRTASLSASLTLDNRPVPCDRCLKLTSDRVFVEKISGPLLIAMGRPIDLNLADENDLIAIPGIGPKLAARILEFRENRGGFSDPRDLIGVRGIGKKKFASISQYVHVTPAKNARSGKGK